MAPGERLRRDGGLLEVWPRDAAHRWTFYIDKTGRITAIDKQARPASSAEDMIAKLAELKVPERGRQDDGLLGRTGAALAAPVRSPTC
jgi:hypothetical protein